jgi:hypothetical protein
LGYILGDFLTNSSGHPVLRAAALLPLCLFKVSAEEKKSFVLLFLPFKENLLNLPS